MPTAIKSGERGSGGFLIRLVTTDCAGVETHASDVHLEPFPTVCGCATAMTGPSTRVERRRRGCKPPSFRRRHVALELAERRLPRWPHQADCGAAKRKNTTRSTSGFSSITLAACEKVFFRVLDRSVGRVSTMRS